VAEYVELQTFWVIDVVEHNKIKIIYYYNIIHHPNFNGNMMFQRLESVSAFR
jgi:hypothetical protein